MAKNAVRIIRSEAEYETALAEIETYFDKEPKRGTPEAERFDLLALVIEDYEKKHWPIDPPTPVDAIRYRMETGGYTQRDLAELLGSRQRASEVLAGKRPLTLEMAWQLHKKWGIAAEALIQPAAIEPTGGRRIRPSAILDARYDKGLKKLYITFVGGKTYAYARVPADVAQAFLEAASKGAFFNRAIRDKYAFREVTELVA